MDEQLEPLIIADQQGELEAAADEKQEPGTPSFENKEQENSAINCSVLGEDMDSDME